jgi:PAS domain S-box-containing protein
VTETRILIVEDEVIVASNLGDRLAALGYTVTGTAFTGEEGIEQALQTRPDLVLMDIRLQGGIDGVAAAQQIRDRLDIPVVYLTGYADSRTLERAKVTEPYGYILKPFEVRELHGAIEMALYKHDIEKRLRESEKRYRTLVEHSLQGIMVIQEAPPRVVFANPRCAEISGCSIDQLLALAPEDALALVHPDDRAVLSERIADHLAGKSVPVTDEFRLLRKDATVRWVEYFASLTEHDGMPAIQAAFVDVTERKLAEQALQAAHDELEERVETRTAELARANALLQMEISIRWEVEDALQQRAEDLARTNKLVSALNQVSTRIGTTLDPDEVLETFGAELHSLGMAALVALKGVDTESLVVHYASVQPDALARAEAMVGLSLCGSRIPRSSWPAKEVIEQGHAVFVADPLAVTATLAPGIQEDVLKRAIVAAGMPPDGPAICLPLAAEEQVNGILVVWGEGLREDDVPALSVFADQVAIAFERAQLARQAAEAEILREVARLRSELIANVSHEIRTPLGLIEVLCTSLLMEDVEFDRVMRKQFLQGIREETDRLKVIVDNLLNLSWLESGQWRLDRRPTDVGQLATEVLETVREQLTQHQAACELAEANLVADVDPRQIETVLSNLLGNAIKYSPGGGTIRIHGYQDEGQVVVCVQDEGIGIPAAEHEKIFERFYRIDNQTTRTVSGVGLGLAVCRGIVDRHGGRIWVESTPGSGSTFCFALPLTARQDAPRAGQPQA